MKKLYIICWLFISFIESNAQDYLNETARWTQTYSHYSFDNFYNCNVVMYFDGDTTVNSLSYLKLYSINDCVYNQLMYDSLGEQYWDIDSTINTNFRGYIREQDQKVYMMDVNLIESFQYDFGQPDFTSVDSVAGYSGCWAGQAPLIMTHNTVCIGTIGRKRWSVSYTQYLKANYFIEGVGPSSGFLAPICGNGCPECGYSLSSFVLNGDTLYQGNCSIPAGITEPVQSEPLIMQTSDALEIQYKDISRLDVFSANGSFVKSVQPMEKDRLVIDFNGLANGIYIYYGNNNGRLVKGKFAVQ